MVNLRQHAFITAHCRCTSRVKKITRHSWLDQPIYIMNIIQMHQCALKRSELQEASAWEINALKTSPQVFPSRCSGCFCCAPVKKERGWDRGSDDSKVRRNAVLAHRKRTKLSWLSGPGTAEKNRVTAVRTRGARQPLGSGGVFESCQHA